jgi:hypothetical protein
MTSPGPECTTSAFEKRQVWPKRMSATVGRNSAKANLR